MLPFIESTAALISESASFTKSRFFIFAESTGGVFFFVVSGKGFSI
jgi:hypothetical protein